MGDFPASHVDVWLPEGNAGWYDIPIAQKDPKEV